MNPKRVLFVSVFICVMAGSLAADEKSQKSKGVINFLVGSVSVETSSGTVAATQGYMVEEGMTVVTGEDGSAEVYFSEAVVVKIMPGSRVRVEQLAVSESDGEKSSFLVATGKMFSKLTRKLKKSEDFTVKTPTVTASVRGTEFVVEAGKEESNIACASGEVLVQKDSEEVKLSAGKEVAILKDQKLLIRELQKMRLQEISAIRGDIRKLNRGYLNQLLDHRKIIRELQRNQRKMMRDGILKDKDDYRKNIRNLPKLPF